MYNRGNRVEGKVYRRERRGNSVQPGEKVTVVRKSNSKETCTVGKNVYSGKERVQ